MFEIGAHLKEARIASGVSMEEAAKDLNIKEVILENIESGSIGCFKDIYELKEYINNYAKYLGLDGAKLIDEFNEYFFEYTSKIPLKEIEKKVQEQNKEKETTKVVSPYTKPQRKYMTKYYRILFFLLAFLLFLVIIWSVVVISTSDVTTTTYGGENSYEFTQ